MSNNTSKLTPADLTALMCARICHDLVSPIGALSAALEVLDDESNVDMHEDAMDLVRSSATQASSKLKFLRLAFGAGTSVPGVVGLEQLKSLIMNMYGGGKVSISWDASQEGLEKHHARLLLNMTMIAVQSIPRGGQINIRVEDNHDAYILTLTAEGLKARIYEEVRKTLSGKAPDEGFDGRTIQPFYTGMMVRELKGRVDMGIDGERVTLTAFLPCEDAQNVA